MAKEYIKKLAMAIYTPQLVFSWFISKLWVLMQSCKASYRLHNVQYEEPGSLEKERRIHAEYEAQDLFNHEENRFADLLERYPGHRKVAVDIGSGAGWLSARLQREGFEKVIAIEPSLAAIKISQQLYPANEYSNIDWINGFSEEELTKLDLKEATLFVTGCVLSHLPDKAVSKICKIINQKAPVGSILAFSECFGKQSHEYMWHIRTKAWWQKNLSGWDLDFYGPNIQNNPARYKGFHGIKVR
jgi:2-polyprenyl-3-methyl-5-hydroxy-6-metoxy-1,4-benzoquinol methylase